MKRLDKASLPLRGGCVLTIGNFDGVHKGHRALLDETVATAKEKGLPSVVWTFKEHPQSFFSGKRFKYISGADEKADLIEKTGASMYYTADFADYRDVEAADFVGILTEVFGVKALLCGYNFSFGRGGTGTPALLKELLSARSVPVKVLPPVCADGAAVSSTRLRALIAGGDMRAARRLLGRLYGFRLPVERGIQLGRAIGKPTINQRFPADRVVPAHGVYASFCEVGGVSHGAVSYIGTKPTVGGCGGAPVCETRIFGFDGCLYGQSLWVRLYGRIRGERKFGSVSELADAIEGDESAAAALLENAQYEAQQDEARQDGAQQDGARQDGAQQDGARQDGAQEEGKAYV